MAGEAGFVIAESLVFGRLAMGECRIDASLRDSWRIRRDGRLLHDMYLVRVKAPAASKMPWDYYEMLDTIPAEQAFQSLEAGGCPLVK